MNSNVQLSWSNTFFYKNFSLYFLVNGRIGGKVVSLTEGYLDRLGVSERTGEDRRHAELLDLKQLMVHGDLPSTKDVTL